jgi:hypothetical protein
VERVRPGDWVRSAGDHGEDLQCRQVVAVDCHRDVVWLVALRKLAEEPEDLLAPADTYVAAGGAQAFLTLRGWKRVDELQPGERPLAAGRDEVVVTFANRVAAVKDEHAGWVPASKAPTQFSRSGYLVRFSRKSLRVEYRDREPRGQKNWNWRRSCWRDLFIITLTGERADFLAGPLQVRSASLDLPAPAAQARHDLQRRLPWAERNVDLWILPLVATLGMTITYALFVINAQTSYTSLMLVWFAGVLGMGSVLMGIAWGYLLLRHLVSIIWVAKKREGARSV